MNRKKPTYLQQRKPKETVNKKLIIGTSSVFAAIVIIMILLFIFNK
ncbi:hypothetical protein [Paenibacillus sp. OAS669]|nr:hypothetical protein [Paenibacillus sp. OAS669]MBE1441053.1 putative membrane protein YvbJ [Paenibacillus sp. OAS669]